MLAPQQMPRDDLVICRSLVLMLEDDAGAEMDPNGGRSPLSFIHPAHDRF